MDRRRSDVKEQADRDLVKNWASQIREVVRRIIACLRHSAEMAVITIFNCRRSRRQLFAVASGCGPITPKAVRSIVGKIAATVAWNRPANRVPPSVAMYRPAAVVHVTALPRRRALTATTAMSRRRVEQGQQG